MSNHKNQKRGELVTSHKREIEEYSSKIVSRGLELVEAIEKKQKERVAYSDTGNKDIEEFKQAIRAKSDDAEAYYRLGQAYFQLGRYGEAIEAYKQTIQIDPDYLLAFWGIEYCYYHLGLSYHELGHYIEAIEAYKQAIQIDPTHAEAHYCLGVTYSELRRYREAIKAYEEAIRIHHDYALAYYGLGRVYLEMKDKSKAIEQFRILKNLLSKYYPLPVTDENTQDIREKAKTLFNLIYK